MNTALIQTMVRKDWDLWRGLILFYAVAGLIGLVVMAIPKTFAFYTGTILLITVLIGCGVHLILSSVVYERKHKTLPFLMSLPVTISEVTTSKLVINMLLFFPLWLGLTLGCLFLIFSRETLPDGMVPFALIMLLELFVAYCLILGVAVVTESEGWTIGTMVGCNLFFNLFMFMVSKNQGIKPFIEGADPVWNAAAWSFLGIEIFLAVSFIGLTYYVQSKKTNFL